MIQAIVIGLCSAACALGAFHATGLWRAARPPVTEAAAPALPERMTRAFHVPVISRGQIAGYVVAQFAYVIAPENAATATQAPDSILVDEAFQALYAQSAQDFENIEKIDLRALTHALVERVNQRMNQPVLREVMVRELNYVPRSDLKPR